MNVQEQKIFEKQSEIVSRFGKRYEKSAADQIAVWEDRAPETQPLLLQCQLPVDLEQSFPDYNPGETHNDKDKMLLSGMKEMVRCALGGMQAVPSIRANMGCGIIPSLFPGITQEIFYDGKMPWVTKHLSADEIRSLRESDIKITDEFKLALEHMAYIAENIKGSGAFLFPLDLQGPFDIAHIVYGDSFFYDLYDNPGLIHHLLDLSCYAFELGLSECFKLIPRSSEMIAHYNDLVLPRSIGGIKVSEDTSTLVGPELIDEFVIPYLGRVLKNAGGGYVHYCGRNDHLFERVIKHDMVKGINFGNPDKHDMEEVLHRVSSEGKVFYGYCTRKAGEDEFEYFSRLIKAATIDGKCRLLLCHSTSPGMCYETFAVWKKACQLHIDRT